MVQSPIKACLAGLMPSSEEEEDDDDDDDDDDDPLEPLELLLLFNLRVPLSLRASVLEKITVARKIDAIVNFMVDVI
jgi:hypothetical protein